MIYKTINPGAMLEAGQYRQVFCRIEYKESEAEQKERQGFAPYVKKHLGTGRLSISGVVGPRSNGDAWGSCGQISDTIREAINAGEFKANDAQGWTVPDVLAFLYLWDQYHLNDMHPECEHQRASGWPQQARQKIKSYMWQLKPDIGSKKKELESEAIERAASVPAGRSVGFNPLERKILKLDQFITTPAEDIGELARFYVPTKNTSGGDYFAPVKEKARGWITHAEDPRGLLGKKCDVCGYAYGSAWQLMPLSKNVLHTFEALAETKIVPAWV